MATASDDTDNDSMVTVDGMVVVNRNVTIFRLNTSRDVRAKFEKTKKHKTRVRRIKLVSPLPSPRPGPDDQRARCPVDRVAVIRAAFRAPRYMDWRVLDAARN